MIYGGGKRERKRVEKKRKKIQKSERITGKISK